MDHDNSKKMVFLLLVAPVQEAFRYQRLYYQSIDSALSKAGDRHI